MSRPSRKRKPVAEDFLRFISVSDPRPSPDGRRVLFTRKHVGTKNDYVTNLWLVPLQGGGPEAFTGGGRDGHGRWSPDGSRIAFLSKRDEGVQIYVIPAGGGEARALTRFPAGSIASFKWSPDGRHLATAFRPADVDRDEAAVKRRAEKGLSDPPRVLDHLLYRMDGDGYFDGRRHSLYVIDAATGDHREVFSRKGNNGFDYDWSPDSTFLALTTNLDRDSFLKPWLDRVFLLEVATGHLRKLPNQGDGMRGAVAWSPDGSRIAVAGREGRDDNWGSSNLHVLMVDSESGRTRTLTAQTDHCLVAETLADTREVSFTARLLWRPDGRRLYSQIGVHGSTHLAAIDATTGATRLLTPERMQATLGGVDREGRNIGLVLDSALELGEVAVAEARDKEATIRKLTAFNRALLDELELVRPEPAWAVSSDGARVHYWRMEPAGLKRGQKAPAVLMVHGGPHAAYGETLMHEFQLLVARGYSVWFGNPRGSKGYGEKHATAIRGRWGDKDWDDVQAIAKAMRANAHVDHKRMGIAGGSYGGYMAAWAISHSDAFRSAIIDRCVSNLVSMAGSSDFPFLPDTYWPGAPWDRPEALWAQSPIAHFANVRTPALIIHSEGDLRCNVEQGEQVFAALQVRGIPSRFVRYPASSSHGMSRSGPPDLKLHRLTESLRWWQERLE